MTTIGSLKDAIDYWRSKKGGKVKANEKLINEMKYYMYGTPDEPGVLVSDVLVGIKKKIKEAKKNKTYHIKSAPGSYRGSWCLTLGSFAFNIEYDYDFSDEPDRKKHKIEFHFWGYDTWDFEKKKVKWYNLPGHLHNLVEETIPSLIAGDGKPFDITYDFYWTLESNETCMIEKFGKIRIDKNI